MSAYNVVDSLTGSQNRGTLTLKRQFDRLTGPVLALGRTNTFSRSLLHTVKIQSCLQKYQVWWSVATLEYTMVEGRVSEEVGGRGSDEGY